MTTSFLITAFATLFVVVNPPGLVPLFIALTHGMGAEKRYSTALRACVIAGVVLAAFGIAGGSILGFIGISMPAFRIAGGLLLFLTAIDMLFGPRGGAQDRDADDHARDPSVFPLATPLIAGSGAIASMILLTEQTGGTLIGKAAVIALMAINVGLTFVFLLLAPAIERLVGRTGVLVVTKLLGMLLAALSVQFVIDGVKGSGLL